jgi:hypothetical protein
MRGASPPQARRLLRQGGVEARMIVPLDLFAVLEWKGIVGSRTTSIRSYPR